MQEMIFYKAHRTTKKEPVESVQITIDEEIPSRDSLEEQEKLYKMQAQAMLGAFKRALPQGTRHQLLIALLQDSPNLYIGV